MPYYNRFLYLSLLTLSCLTSVIGNQTKAFSQTIPDRITQIVQYCHKYKFTKAQCAYTLATIEHETAYTFAPVREAYWLSEAWRAKNLWYYPFYGRGHIQLTHLRNYINSGKKLNVKLAENPDLALNNEISLDVAFTGLRDGDFTGLRLSQFVINSLTYANLARQTVNGMDDANQIAQRAHFWFSRLTVY